MKKYITHHWVGKGVWEFDTETGKVKKAPNIDNKAATFGSVWKQNGKWFVFHRDDRSYILQHKKKTWRVDPEYTTILFAFIFIRNFRIKKNGKTIFSFWYKPKGIMFWFIDPTYDGIDAEADDFFLYVRTMWKSCGKMSISEYQERISQIDREINELNV